MFFCFFFYLTPLHLAVQTNNADLIRTFVNLEKTDLNCRDDQGNSPLHIAVKLNNLEIIKILCSSHRIDKNLRDNNIFIFGLLLMEFNFILLIIQDFKMQRTIILMKLLIFYIHVDATNKYLDKFLTI